MERKSHRTRLLRHVFYISGFDPRGAGFLYKNFKSETVRWSAASGTAVSVGVRRKEEDGVQSWTMAARYDDADVETRFVFMGWDDIIRAHWPRGEWNAAVRMLGCFLDAMVSGVLARVLRQSWPFAVTMTGAAGRGLTVLALSVLLLIAVGLAVFLPAPWGYLAAAIPVGLALWAGFWARGNLERFQPGWTSRTTLFSRRFAVGGVSELDPRIEAFAKRIIAGIEAEPADEVLLVGHSFGTALATLTMAEILQLRPQWGGPDGPVTLITLGQIQSSMLYHPRAGWFRERLEIFADHPHLSWFDFSSPPDGACFALVSVLEHLDPPPRTVPVLLNAQFHKTFSPQRMNEARADRLKMHFLYLMAPDTPQLDTDLYDFVALVAGPRTVRDRYRDRASGQPFFARRAA